MLSTSEVIDRLFAEAATGDVDRVLRWWADDGVLEDVSLGKAFYGRDELAEYLQMYYAAFPDLVYEPLYVLIDGPNAVVEWAQSCTLQDSFDGIQPDGRRLFIRAVDLFYITDGLVRRERSWYGDMWMRQRMSGDASLLPPTLPLLDT